MSSEKKPPMSAEDLLERYAGGERDFSFVDLCDADLRNVDLTGVQLRDADLSGANLSGANLTQADLTRAWFESSWLKEANLTRSNLTRANLSGARLTGAGLKGAILDSAHLGTTDFVNADLTDTYLSGANLSGADLSGANLSGAHLRGTLLLDLDLSSLCNAYKPIWHHEPSTVDFRSVVKSLGSPSLKAFLQATGMPEVFIEYMIDSARTLDPLEVFKLLQSTFISYGGPDEHFARKLYEAMHRNGVRSFLFSEHAVPGQKIGRTVRQGINSFDRVVLVCSRNSLDKKGVMAEVEHALSREDREGGTELIIPVLLDDYLFAGWSPSHPDVLLTLKDRVVADFRGWDADPTKFDQGLRKLIMALKK